MILYHGTTTKHLESIRKNGLVPRGKKPGNYEGKIASRSDLVYLTSCYAAYYALCARTDGEDKPVVLKIEIDPKKTRLYPDEDFLYHAIQPQQKLEDIEPRVYEDHWEKSLNYMGVVAVDEVPTENIIGYHVGEGMDFINHCDPSVSPLNYKVCSGMYIEHLESLSFNPL
jgi:hypothetical protein